MAKDIFETMLGTGILNDDFFKTIDDLTKNIQSTIHTIQEKYENGQLVEKNEEKYENGEKTLDVHETAETNSLENTCNKCCCGACNSSCNCKHTCTVDEKDEQIAGLEVDVQNLQDEVEQWRNAYYKVLSEKEELEDKFSTIKNLFK
jgi:hypothetical protein